MRRGSPRGAIFSCLELLLPMSCSGALRVCVSGLREGGGREAVEVANRRWACTDFTRQDVFSRLDLVTRVSPGGRHGHVLISRRVNHQLTQVSANWLHRRGADPT